jgi:hypothetical protein
MSNDTSETTLTRQEADAFLRELRFKNGIDNHDPNGPGSNNVQNLENALDLYVTPQYMAPSKST